MRLPWIRFTIRSLLIAIPIVAIPMAFLRPGVELETDEQVVEFAVALVMQEDATFLPDKHRAKSYRVCGSPLTVDFYPDMGACVVKRVKITDRGDFLGPFTFTVSDRVKSSRDGAGVYLLDRTGHVFAFSPNIIGIDGEVAGLGSPVPVHQPSP
jgi:hypothetical protein